MGEIFVQIGLVIAIVLAVSFIMRALRQPLIIGYIISGIIIGPFFLDMVSMGGTLQVFADFGIAFLLFIVGLHLSPKVVKEVGGISLITGVGQVVFTAFFGYFIAIALGFEMLTSIYIAVALTFSSTIIITKLLSDKGDIDSLYGKISIGILLVQDIIAIFILIIVSSLSSGSDFVASLGTTLLKGAILTALIVPISTFVLPKAQSFFSKSQEFLFVFSIAWGLGLAALFQQAGLSLEVGALIAGIVLSASPYILEIRSKLKPLRDFFIISFFIVVGSNIVLEGFSEVMLAAIVLSVFVIAGKPLTVMAFMGISGYTKRTSFSTGIAIAQISEFSIILIALGVKVGHLSQEILSFVTLMGLFTFAGSTYMVMYSDELYSKFSRYLGFFERRNLKAEKQKTGEGYKAILFGYSRTGFSILSALNKQGIKCLVVEINPETVRTLKKIGIPCIYGDAHDKDFLDEIPLDEAKLVISTIPEYGTNAILVKAARELNSDAVILVRAKDIGEAFRLYDKGANYVLTPYFLGGEHIAKMIREFKLNSEMYEKEKKEHIGLLRDIFKKEGKAFSGES
jgi:Kef-type K+ transport system membrane component KefB